MAEMDFPEAAAMTVNELFAALRLEGRDGFLADMDFSEPVAVMVSRS